MAAVPQPVDYMNPQVPGELPWHEAACTFPVADQVGDIRFEPIQKSGDIRCQGFQAVVAVCRLRRGLVATDVHGNRPVTRVCQHRQLVSPGSGVIGEPVQQQNQRPLTEGQTTEAQGTVGQPDGFEQVRRFTVLSVFSS